MPAAFTEPDAPSNDRPAGPATDNAGAAALHDRTPAWVRTTPEFPVYAAAIGLVFCWFSFQPIWHTDLWAHLAYGRLIVETGGLPAFEPFMPLAADVPLVDSAWLTQSIGYLAIDRFGPTALSFLYAAAIAGSLSLMLWRFHERTQSVAFGLLGLGAFLWIGSHVLAVIRPQLAGMCCFVALLVLLTSRRRRRGDWAAVALLFALWANLHGSFPMGLLLLGTFCAGRALDVWRRTGRPSRAWRDKRTRRLFLLTVIAASAALLNPYGVGLYAEVAGFASNPNLQDLKDWEPLTLRMEQGRAAFATAAALAVLVRLSPRRVTAAETLLLFGLGTATLWSSRFLAWWIPVAALSLVVHAHAVARRYCGWPNPPESVRRSLWTAMGLGLAAICFAVTPPGVRLLRGEDPPLQSLVSPQTPLGAADYLKANPPEGQIFNALEQGDYLVWDGPPGLAVFVTSHAHLVPPAVWNDYITVIVTRDGWDDVLRRYGVNTVVCSRRHVGLQRNLHRSSEWEQRFADDATVVFRRNPPPAE